MGTIGLTPQLIGERITLEPMSLAFCTEKYLSWLNDPDVHAHLATNGNYTMEDLREFVVKNTRNGILFWAVVVKSGNLHIGNIKVDKINTSEMHGEYGIMIGDKSAWGKGYAAEASQMLIDYCFDKAGLKAIHLGVHAENVAAVNLYKKLGFDIVATETPAAGKIGENDFYYRMTLLNQQ